MNRYHERRAKLRTRTTQPTMTDQSAARETDRHIIVTRFLDSGQTRGSATTPTFGDFTGLPTNKREAIDMARGLASIKKRLPKELEGFTLEQLAALSREQLLEKLTPKPPEPPTPEPKQEDKK